MKEEPCYSAELSDEEAANTKFEDVFICLMQNKRQKLWDVACIS